MSINWNPDDPRFDILKKPNPNVFKPSEHMVADTEYNRKKQAESMEARKQEIITGVSLIESKIIKNKEEKAGYSLTHLMDILEEVVKTCGGESQLEYLDVGRTFIKVKTRVPMTAGLFPAVGENEINPRFHKTVTKILLLIPEVLGVRWIPTEDRGSYIVVSVKEE